MTQSVLDFNERLQDDTIGTRGTCTEYRMSQLLDHSQADGMIWNPDSSRLPFGQHDLGYEAGASQNKSIWSGKKSFHCLEGIVGNSSVLANIFEIRTDEAERFVFRSTFQLINTGDGVLVENIAANTVIGVSWISNNSTVKDNFYCPTNKPFLWIVRVYLQDHHVVTFGRW